VACAAYLDSRLDWDTHDDIADQGTSHEQLFSELTEISNKLAAAGLLERTTVAVLSEFSRTPKLNDQAQPGKDHWPVTSALLFGGGVRAGTYGATDDGLGALRVRMDDGTPADTGRLLGFDNFAAGLLEFLGVSSKRWIANAEPFSWARLFKCRGVDRGPRVRGGDARGDADRRARGGAGRGDEGREGGAAR
jgi:uncharacterized protein (DUF1501 family)